MLFMVTQTHTPEACPIDEGGSKTLYNPSAEGVELRAMYGAFAEHVVYYLIEAESLGAIQQFLRPGFKRCSCQISPVEEKPIVR